MEFSLKIDCFRAIEYMICDALVEADSVLGISSSIDDASSYLHLTDSIISTIASSPDPRLAKSQQIIKDLRCRRIYRLAHERVLTRDEAVYFPKNVGLHSFVVVLLLNFDVFKAKITACEVVSYQHDSNLTPDDIIIQQFQLGYSMVGIATSYLIQRVLITNHLVFIYFLIRETRTRWRSFASFQGRTPTNHSRLAALKSRSWCPNNSLKRFYACLCADPLMRSWQLQNERSSISLTVDYQKQTIERERHINSLCLYHRQVPSLHRCRPRSSAV